MKKIFLLLVSLMAAGAGMAQIPYGSIVEAAKQNSPYFKAIEAQREAAGASAYATPMLDNPEVEFGYYNGSPSDVGRRWDLSASQTFEMPNVYANRAKLRKSKAALAGVEADFAEIDLVKEIQMLCSELVYQRALLSVMDRCLNNAEEIAQNYGKRMENGDCSILEYNRAQMEAVAVRGRRESVDIDRAKVARRLMQMTMMTPQELASALDGYAGGATASLAMDPSLKTAYTQEESLRIMVAEGEVGEARAELMPKISVGYASENVVGETFRGVAVGLELPLWRGNRGVKAAKAAAMAEKVYAENRLKMVQDERSRLNEIVVSKMNMLQALKHSMAQCGDSMDLLRKSLEGGQMTLEEYLLQVDFYTEAEISVLDAQKDLDQAYIEFCAISR